MTDSHHEKLHHHHSEPWSADRPIPFTQKIDLRKREEDKQTQQAEKGQQETYDPITQSNVSIKDLDKDDLHRAFQNLDRILPYASLGHQEQEQQPNDQDRQGANAFTDFPKDKSTNLLFHPLPKLDERRWLTIQQTLFSKCAIILVAFSMVLQLIPSLWFRMPLMLVSLYVVTYYFASQAKDALEGLQVDQERQRGTQATQASIPESTEWLNQVLGTVWPLLDPEILAPGKDLLEDVMQANVPKLISLVKVVDFNQGLIPARVLSMTILPEPQDNDQDLHPEEEEEDDKVGKRVHVECKIAYRATDHRLGPQARNAKLMLEFAIGSRSLAVKRVPIFVEVKGMVATVRLAIQMTPKPPFVKNITFSLMGLPYHSISAVPLHELLPNVVSLPLIGGFVQKSIDVAMAEYVAPRSMTFDVGELISGDGLKKQTEAFGVLVITIHSATDLEKTDTFSDSDPYILIQYSRLGRPLYSTRIIQDELHPRFEETAYILVTSRAIQADESISAELWDSDRLTNDDMLGRTEMNVRELVRKRGELQERQDDLKGFQSESSKSGKLNWSIVYHPLKKLDDRRKTDGSDPRIPDELREKSELLDDAAKAESEGKDLPSVMRVPPNPDYVSGVLSVTVGQIVDLAIRDKGSPLLALGNRKSNVGNENQTSEQTEEEAEDAPSSYVKIAFNDTWIYKSRIKAYTNNPFFSAGTERFVPDYTKATIMVVVYAKLPAENDAILGVVHIKIADALSNASCVRNWYPLAGGVGHGSIRISLLFRSFEMHLPRNQLAFHNVGTARVLSDLKVCDFQNGRTAADFKDLRIRLRTLINRITLKSKTKGHTSDESVTWELDVPDPPLRLPFKRRNASAIVIFFRGSSRMPGRRKSLFVATLWLRDMEDDKVTRLRLPVWESDDLDRITQNYLPADIDSDKFGNEIKQVATLEIALSFHSGLDEVHRTSVATDSATSGIMSAWDTAVNAGVRPLHRDTKTQDDEYPTSSDSDDNDHSHEHGDHDDHLHHSDNYCSDSENDQAGDGSSNLKSPGDGDSGKVQGQTKREAMHNRRQGAAQYKTFRTGQWLSSNVMKKARSIKNKMHMSSERTADLMESEAKTRRNEV